MANNTKTQKRSLYGRAKDYKSALSQAYNQGFKDGYAAYSQGERTDLLYNRKILNKGIETREYLYYNGVVVN